MGDNNYLQDYNTTGNVSEHFVQQFTHQPHPNPSSHQFGQTFTPINGGIPQQPFTPSLPSLRPDSPLGGADRLVIGGQTIQTQIASPLDLFIDFTRPDGQRTRPLLVEGKRLYVDEHYVSVWSPVLRSWCVECPDRELILANVQYDHVLEVLSAIHPTYKEVDDQTVHLLLPIAFDYQMDGLLHRCECFLIANKMPFLEKLWLADRFQLSRLLALLLKELRPNTHKLDLSGPRYSSLSDRELPEPPIDMEHMLSPSDLNFASVRAKTGRAYHVNPYYVAAWSTLFQERFCNGIGVESNIAPILMAACKLESHGLLRKCATILLSSQTQLSVFVRLSLLDRCRLQELLEQYECLSTRAKSAMMDRFAQLVNIQGIQQFPLQSTIHICTK
uniref:BTB domain-containing protein n=1 Tax=Meloidogyne javanica TaxID=6303 RepID=A0A915MP25_MELJA